MSSLAPSLLIALLLALPGAGQGRGGSKPAPAPPAPPAAEEDVAQQYFEIADYDSNNWITISEAKAAMQLDRASFALYDEDGDGRIGLPEFRARYEKLVKNGGALPAPASKGGVRTSSPSTPAEIALRFDADGDESLSRAELREFLGGLRTRLDPDVVLSKFDRDGSRRLDKAEIGTLAAFLDPARRKRPPERVASIAELFGKCIPREEREGATMIPPLIVGPVPVFRRLDLDADGRITAEELHGLQRPIQLPVRIAAVIATLDTNVDGVIDAAEFQASMAGP